MRGSLRLVYFVFCMVIALITWSLGYGLALAFLFGDSRIIQTTITTNPFVAFQQLALYSNNPVLQRVSAGAFVPALLIAGVVAYAGSKRVTSPLGDARFQTVMSLRSAGWFRRKGHILGRFGRKLLRVGDERHHLIIGPTRSGKGASYVIPNALTHEGSMIVTDLKGEIFRSTAGYRKSKGNQVFLFAPGSDRTHRYNPLDFIRSDRGDRTADIQNMASILVPESVDSENAIWQVTAQQVIAGVISYVDESVFYRDRRNLGEVRAFFNSGVDLQAMMALIKEKEPDLSRFTVESFNTYIALSERAAASALLDVQKALRPFRNERVVAATLVTDMDLRALKHRPISIYLAPNITDIALLKPLLALFVQQTLNTLLLDHEKRSLPIYFLLDEFRQLKKLSEITTKLPYVAGYNIKMAFVIQDLKNLDEIYGETARHSLIGNCGYQLVLGANDQATAEAISKSLGRRTVRYKTESRTIELMGLHRRTKVEQVRERDLMMPQEVRQLSTEKMLVLVEGQSPILADKLRFFTAAPFKKLEAFSRTHVPSVSAVEFLPERPTPATTEFYRDSGPGALSVASGSFQHSARQVATALGADQLHRGISKTAVDIDAPGLFEGQKRRTSRAQALESRFDSAARMLKTLVAAKSKNETHRATKNWSAIFDETVPDANPDITSAEE